MARKKRKKQQTPPQKTGEALCPVDAPREGAGLWRDVLVCLALITITVAVFGQVVWQDFVAYDDQSYVYENPRVTGGLSASSLRWALTRPHMGNYHPITMLSLLLDVQLFGVRPGAMKAVNLALHIASVLLLFWALRTMTGVLWRSAIVAALFAVHPLHVEPVVWISSRKDMLSGFFLMLTLLAYARYAKRPGGLRYLWVALCFALGLFSKPMLVTAPCLLLLLDYWPLGRVAGTFSKGVQWRIPAKLVAEKIPLFLLTAVGALTTFYAQEGSKAVAPLGLFSFRARVFNALAAYAAYIYRMFWPEGLSPHYPHPGASIPAGQVILAVLLLAAITLVVLCFSRRHPFLPVGWLWYLGTLVPVIGLVQVGAQASADRYTYIPLIGLFIMLVWGLARVAEARRYLKIGFSAAAVAALLLVMGAAWRQTSRWRDSETLFRYAVEVNPENARMRNSLGSILMQGKDLEKAAEHFEAAIRLDPGYVNPRTNLGSILLEQGDVDGAIEQYSSSIRIDPAHVNSHYNLGNALLRKGRVDEAIAQYAEAVRLQPDYVSARYNLGNALMRQDRAEQAIVQYREALRLDPTHAHAKTRLENALKRKRERDAEIAGQTEAVRAAPDDSEAHYQLGKTFFRQHRYAEAIAAYREALRLDPKHANAHYQLGNVFYSQAKLEEAARSYQEALRIDPAHAHAHSNLGNVFLQQGKTEAAVEQYKNAIRLDPNHADAHSNLGTALLNQGKRDAAIEHYKEALRINPAHSNARSNLERVQTLKNDA